MDGWTYGWECGDLLLGQAVVPEVFLSVVDRHAALDGVVVGTVFTQVRIRVLGHALVGAILVAEVHDCGPVVGKILGVSAGGAFALFANVAFHGCVESIAADDLGGWLVKLIGKWFVWKRTWWTWVEGITPG